MDVPIKERRARRPSTVIEEEEEDESRKRGRQEAAVYSFSCNLRLAQAKDDKDEYLRLIKHPEFVESYRKQAIFYIFGYDALNIARAVFNGETQGVIDPVIPDGWSPLHLSATNSGSRMLSYFLQRGHNVDDVLLDNEGYHLKQATPIDFLLEEAATDGYRDKDTEAHSLFWLLWWICHGERRRLEALRILVRNTKNTERVRTTFVDYAHKGKVLQVLLLFLSAPELFNSTVDMLLVSLEKRIDVGEGMSLLLDVLATVGDKVAAYVRLEEFVETQEPKIQGDVNQTILEIAYILREVVHIKEGVFSPHYFLRFFKNVPTLLKLQDDQLSCSRDQEEEDEDDEDEYLNERDECLEDYISMLELKKVTDIFMYLPYLVTRSDFNEADICKLIPTLEPYHRGQLDRAIDNKLASMSGRFEVTTKSNKMMEKQVRPQCQGFPFRYHYRTCGKPRFYSMITSTITNRWEMENNLVLKKSALSSASSLFVKLSHLPMIAKRLIK